MPPGSGLDTDLNYVRNSVKATVDAYDGTVHFYVVDPTDPIIKTYRKAFPDLFEDIERRCRPGCSAHMRYPEDIFDAQTEQYALYHMTDPLQYFHKQAIWDVAPSPDAAEHGTTAATAAGRRQQRRPQHDARRRRAARSTRCTSRCSCPEPSESAQEFVLERSFVPRQQGRILSVVHGRAERRRTTTASSSLYQVPDQSTRRRPRQRRDAHRGRSEFISSQFTLLDQLRIDGRPGRRAADTDRQRDHLRAADLDRRRGQLDRSRATTSSRSPSASGRCSTRRDRRGRQPR